ncbi:MAG: tetratricopeptide repeat protein [Candidatus Hydrothermales bacterium]
MKKSLGFLISIIFFYCAANPHSTAVKIYMQQQNFEKMIEEAEKWAKSEPKNPEPYLWISRAYTLTNKYVEGANYLFKSFDMGLKKKLEDIDKTTLFNAGIVANQEKNYDFAIKCFEKLKEIEPDSPKIYINLAAFYQSKGDAKRAKETLEEGQKRAKDDILMSYYLARFYMEENPDKAEEIAKNNIGKEINKELKSKFYGLLGEIYSNKRNYEEAEKFFKEAYLSDSSNINYLFNIAFSNFLSKKYKESIAYFEKYAKKNPEEADVYEYIGRAYHLTNSYEKALEYYKKSLSLKEKSEIYKLIADCYSRLGKNKEALEALKKASELEGKK